MSTTLLGRLRFLEGRFQDRVSLVSGSLRSESPDLSISAVAVGVLVASMSDSGSLDVGGEGAFGGWDDAL